MAFHLKNLSATFLTIDVGGYGVTLLPGRFAGPFNDDELTDEIRMRASKRQIAVFDSDMKTEDVTTPEPQDEDFREPGVTMDWKRAEELCEKMTDEPEQENE